MRWKIFHRNFPTWKLLNSVPMETRTVYPNGILLGINDVWGKNFRGKCPMEQKFWRKTLIRLLGGHFSALSVRGVPNLSSLFLYYLYKFSIPIAGRNISRNHYNHSKSQNVIFLYNFEIVLQRKPCITGS